MGKICGEGGRGESGKTKSGCRVLNILRDIMRKVKAQTRQVSVCILQIR